MVDDLRTVLAEHAGDVALPIDLLARVEAGAGRVRRRRWLVGAGAAAAVVAAVAVTLPLTLSGAHHRAAIVTAGPDTACTGLAGALPTPANALAWPCRGTDPATLALAIAAFRADHPGQLVGPYRQLWEGRTPLGGKAAAFQLWLVGGRLAATVTVADGNLTYDTVLPATVAGIVRKLPGNQPGGMISGDSEGLLVVAAPDVTSAVYDDGLGHLTAVPLVDGVAVTFRATARDDARDSVTLTRPGGSQTIGVDDQQHPTTVVPPVRGLSEDAARDTLAAAGLDGGPSRPPATLPLGGTAPPAGTVVATGTRVQLTYVLPPTAGTPASPSPSPTPISSAPLVEPTTRPVQPSPAGSSRADSPTPQVPTSVGLAYPVPAAWSFRGDMAAFDRLTAGASLAAGVTPLWAGTLDGRDTAVVLASSGAAAGDISLQTWLPGSMGPYVAAGKQTLIDDIHAYAATLPGGGVLVLGPPGTAYLTIDAGQGGQAGSVAVLAAPDGAAVITPGSAPASVPITAMDAKHQLIFSGTISTRDSGLRD